MPNNKKRYETAEEIRQDVDYARRNFPMTPKNMAILNAYMEHADYLEKQNEREDMYDDMEMRRGGRRKRDSRGRFTNEYDGGYDVYENPHEAEMRRGRRRMDYDTDIRYETHNPNISNPNPQSGYHHLPYPAPLYPYINPYMPRFEGDNNPQHGNPNQPQSAGQHMQNRKPSTIGFSSQGQSEDRRHDKMANKLAELEQYYADYMKHKKAYEQTNDPTEKQHMLMELKEFNEYMEEIIKHLERNAKSPEEQQYLQELKQRLI